MQIDRTTIRTQLAGITEAIRQCEEDVDNEGAILPELYSNLITWLAGLEYAVADLRCAIKNMDICLEKADDDEEQTDFDA